QTDKTAQVSKPVQPVKTPAAGAADDPLSSGQIKSIHALGGTVVMTNEKDEQKATGDDAIYDVKAQTITMTGQKVVLTQKGHIFDDTKLLIQVDTHQAVLCSANYCPDDAPPKADAATQKPTRGHARLQPTGGVNASGEANKKEKAKEKTAAPPKP